VAAVALWLALPAWRRFWRLRTLAVGAAYAATMLFYVLANKHTTAANAIFLQSTAPMYLLFLGPLLLRERVQRADIALTVAIAGGMTLFFIGIEPPQRTAPDPVTGNVFGACAGASWALTILGMRWLGRRDDDAVAGSAVIAGNLLAAAFALPLALPAAPGAVDLGLVLYLGVFQIGLAYVALSRGIGGVPALEASLLLLLEPVLNAIWAWGIHGERPGPWALTGCLVILAATFSAAFASRKTRPGDS
jgi:drug/metabolite transporter (DMT)-like permease